MLKDSIAEKNMTVMVRKDPLEKVEIPEIPCPLVHPPASRAPKTRKDPPINEQIYTWMELNFSASQ